MRLLLPTIGALAIVLAPMPTLGQEGVEADDVQDILDEDLDETVTAEDLEGGGVAEVDETGDAPGPPGKSGWFQGTGGSVDWDASFHEEMDAPASVFVPSRQQEEPFHSSSAAWLVTGSDIEDAQAVGASWALADVPGLVPLATSAAGPSPVMRGLLGQRVGLMFDGISLHHSTVPAGPTLLAGTVDPLALSSIEVWRGPGLVMAGPLSVGGTINFVPRLPVVNPLVSFRSEGRAMYRYGSIDTSHVVHGDVGFQLYDTAATASLTYGSFGGLQSGSRRQPYTEHGMLSFDLAVRRALGLTSDLLFYYGTTRLSQVHQPAGGSGVEGDGFMRWPQMDRNLIYGRYTALDLGPLDTLQLTLGVHMWNERPQLYSENAAIVPTLTTWDRQVMHTTSAFALAWGRAPLGAWGSLLAGVDYYADLVDADGWLKTYQGAEPPVSSPLERTWIPDGARSHALEPHVLMEIYALRPFLLSLGGRFWYHDLDPGGGLEARHLVGGAGLVSGRYAISDLVAFVLSVSYGTRPPTMFEYAGRSCAPLVQSSSPDLGPEGTLGAELGTKWSVGVLEGSLFYGFTLLDHAIMPLARDPAPGEDPCTAPSRIAEWSNEGLAWIHSIEFDNRVNIGQVWTIGTVLTWNHGTGKADGGRQPLAAIPPLTGTAYLTVRYPRQYLWADVRLRFGLAQTRLAPDEIVTGSEKDPFFLLSIRGGLDLGSHLRLYVAFENLVGDTYRVHGSWIDGPGRSVHVGFEGHL
jgi:outer membrane receptor protein involved in Fe transport